MRFTDKPPAVIFQFIALLDTIWGHKRIKESFVAPFHLPGFQEESKQVSKSCEIHRAEWDIFYPADLDEKRVPQILRPLTNVEHEMNDFPWYVVGRLVELLEKPESSFAYLHVTVYFRARAAMLALNGDILDHTDLFGALSKHQLQVCGIYRKHLQNYLLLCMQKHNMDRLPECDRHRMDPFDDPSETETNRDLMRRCIQAAERAFINTLNFISEGPEMDARIEGESVEFWVKRIERDRAMDVRVRVTRNAGGYRTALETIKTNTTDPDIQDLCDDVLTDPAEVPT